MFIVEDPTMTLKYIRVIKALFLYFNLCLSVMLDSLSGSFTSRPFLTIHSKFSYELPCFFLLNLKNNIRFTI